MAIDVSSVQTFTDAQLLVLYRNALAAVTVGQSYSINGRSMTRADLPEIRETIDWLEARIQNAAATDSGGGIAIVQFGER